MLLSEGWQAIEANRAEQMFTRLSCVPNTLVPIKKSVINKIDMTSARSYK